jgi:hypothetical protein
MARLPNLTNDQLEQLIELFHEEPRLWDVNDTDQMNVYSRTAALNRIGSIMKLSSGKYNYCNHCFDIERLNVNMTLLTTLVADAFISNLLFYVYSFAQEFLASCSSV